MKDWFTIEPLPPTEWWASFFDTKVHCTHMLDMMAKACGIPNNFFTEQPPQDLAFLECMTLTPVVARVEWN